MPSEQDTDAKAATQAAPPEGSAWLRVAEVARLLGVSRNTARRWTDEGVLASYRSPGGHRRYLRDEVAAAIAAGRTGAPRPTAATEAGVDLLASVRRQLAALDASVDAALELIGSLLHDAPGVSRRIAETLTSLTGLSSCEVATLDHAGLRVVASVSNSRRLEDREGARLDEGLRRPLVAGADKTARNEHPYALLRASDPGLSHDARRLLADRDSALLLIVPLLVDGQFAGTLELRDPEERDLDREIGIATGFAEIAAHALKVASFVERLEARDRAARALVEVSTLASQATAGDELLRGVTRRLSAAIEASRCDIYAAVGERLVIVAAARNGEDDDEWLGIDYELDHFPATAAAIATREPLIVTAPDDPRLTPLEAETFQADGFAAECSLPLYAGETLVGILDIGDDRSPAFLEYLDLIRAVGQIVADALVKTDLLAGLARQNKLMSELVELSAMMPTMRDVGATPLASLGVRLLETIGADTCEIYALHDATIELLAGFQSDGSPDQWVGWTAPLDEFPTTAAALDRREVLVVTGRADPRLTAYERERFAEFDYESEICVPLVVDGAPIGFLDIFDTRPRDFAEFADFLRGFAPVLARTIQNAVLLREVEGRNEALHDLVSFGELIAQVSDLGELLRLSALRLLTASDATYCDVYRLDGDDLVQVVSVGPDGFADQDNGFRAPLAHYPQFADAVRSGDLWIVSSTDDSRLSQFERSWYESYGLKSSLCVPLVVDGEPIGVIDIEDSRERDYAELVDFMRNVGQLLSGAFEKAFLLDRLEASNRELRQLVDAGLEFGASLELGEVLRSVAQGICAATGGVCCDVYSTDGTRLVGLASVNRDGRPVDGFAGTAYDLHDLHLERQAVERREAVVVGDVRSDERMSPAEREEWLRFGFLSGIVVPLVTRGEVAGTVEVFDTEPRDFERSEVLTGLAQIGAQALANARLHAQLEETAGRMTLMTEASLEFSSSLDLRDILVKVGRRLSEVVDVPNCDIDVVRDDMTTYRIMSLTNGEVDELWLGMTLDLAAYPALRLAYEGREPVVVASLDDPRLTDEGRARNRHHDEKSWLTLPLVAKDRVIGLVDLVETRRERTFSEQEVGAAMAVCRVAAMAIDNADLYDTLAATNRETEMLNAIAREAAASLDVGEIARSAAEHLRELVHFDAAFMVTTTGERLRVVYADPVLAEQVAGLEGLSTAPVSQAYRRVLRQRPVAIMHLPTDNPLAPFYPEIEAGGTLAFVAVVLEGHIIGGFCLWSAQDGAFDRVDVPLLERVGTHLALAFKNARLYEDVKQMHLSNLKALSSALNAKDYYTLGHAARVSAYTVLLGSKLGWSEELVRGAEEAAYLHDIGKIGISDRVLLKPGKLNAEEWELMRQHPVFSADIIRTLFNEQLVLGVRHHHERWDGGGYPDGLRGEEIPLIARAMCIVDSYDAMSFVRPYRQSLNADECLEELRRCRGLQFDPMLTDLFIDVLRELEERRRYADQVAAQAAARISGDQHRRLRDPSDEGGADYREIAAVLREVRDANPPTMYLTTQAHLGRRYVLVVDPEEDPEEHSELGSDIFPDEILQVLPQVLAGEHPRVNALFADQYGVWVTGVAPILDSHGEVVAVVAADLPPFVGAEHGGLRGAGKETLASILQSAAVRSSRGEIDAIADGLTGLYNHRYLHERLNEEFRRSEELAAPLSLLFCDLDFFKEFNETYGHRAGDDALRSVAHVVEQSIRHIDLGARYGGEEFVVALIGTDAGGAVEVAERIRERVHETVIPPSSEPLSVSIGVATFPLDGVTKEELLDKADWALHVAKRLGRNKVVSFSPAQPDMRTGSPL